MTVSAVTGLDHFVIRVRDLDDAQDRFTRLGFALTPRGFHSGRGSANHTVPLAGGTYFEILAFAPGSPGGFSAHTPLDFAGPVAVALRTPDSARVHADLVAMGFDVPAPRDLSRPVELAGGTELARFLNASFPPVRPARLSLFTCQHLTRELVWRPEWQMHPNGAQNVVSIIIVVPEPPVLHAAYAQLFAGAEISVDGTLVVPLGASALRFVSPTSFAARYPGVAMPRDLADGWFAGATITVASVDAVRDLLDSNGIAWTASGQRGIAADLAASCGTLIAFEQAAG